MPVPLLSRLRPAEPAPAPGPMTPAVLSGARSLVSRGWLQGSWFVIEAPGGSRRSVGPGSLAARGSGTVVAACLVGAVVEAAHRHSAQRHVAWPALDELWWALRGGDPGAAGADVPGAAAHPAARRVRVRELAAWNDHPDRVRADVLDLLDAAAARLTAAPRGGCRAATRD